MEHEYNLRSKHKIRNQDELNDISHEKNIIKFGAQNNNYNNKKDFNLLNVKNPQKKIIMIMSLKVPTKKINKKKMK